MCVCIIVTWGDFDCCCYFRCICCCCYSLPTSPPVAAPSSLRNCSLWRDQTRGLLIAAIVSISVGCCLLQTIWNQKQINNTSASAFAVRYFDTRRRRRRHLPYQFFDNTTPQNRSAPRLEPLRWHNLQIFNDTSWRVIRTRRTTQSIEHLSNFTFYLTWIERKNALENIRTQTHSLFYWSYK